MDSNIGAKKTMAKKQASNSAAKTKRRWRRMLLLALFVVIVSSGGWFYLKQTVATRLQTQLASLGMGRPEIGSLAIGLNGIVATDLQFFQPETPDESWLSLDELVIDHPLVGLATGDQVFNKLEIVEPRVVIDLDQPRENSKFEFSNVEIPARVVELTHATVILRQQDRTDLMLEGISLTTVNSGATVQFSGTVEKFVQAAWSIGGEFNPGRSSFQAQFETDQAQLVDGQWQRWPGLPDSLENQIRADATASVSVSLQGDQQVPFLWNAKVQLEQAQLRLPSLDLPIRIERGEANITDGNIKFSNVVGTSDGQDRLFVEGSTNIDRFPVTTDFELLFRNMDLATMRKLVRNLPEELDGRVEGSVAGSVSVEQSRQTTVELSAAGRSVSLDYGSIGAKNSSVHVEVQSLILDKNQVMEKLDGSVVVNATLEKQSADDVFETFNLQDLQRQLSIDAVASGEVRFELPLATAANLETWQLNVSALAPSARFSQQDVRNVRAEVVMAGGNLKFTEITAKPMPDGSGAEAFAGVLAGNETSAQLNVSLDWPLVSAAKHQSWVYSMSPVSKFRWNG